MRTQRLSLTLAIPLALSYGCDELGGTGGGGGAGGAGGNGGGGPCDADYDCIPAEVCGDEGICVEAGPTDTRTFASVTLDFAGDVGERHLLVAYIAPTEVEEDDEIPLVTIHAEDAGGGNWMPRTTSKVRTIPADLLARMQLERARRNKLDHLIDRLHAGEITLAPARGRAAGNCATDCGDTQMCWKGPNDASHECRDSSIELTLADGTSTITASLVTVLTHPTDATLQLNVLLDDTDAAASAEAETAATFFLSTLPAQLEILGLGPGHTGDIDRDGDARMTVVFSSALPGNTAGYFDFQDFLPASDSDATGNEADLLWAQPPVTDEEAHITGTLAHEYTHLASFAVRVAARDDDALREVLWLDEGLAHLMEDLTGWGGSNVETVQFALDGWTDGGFAVLPPSGNFDLELIVRGQSYLLLRHLIDSQGNEDAASPATMSAARALVSELIAEEKVGWEHDVFQAPEDEDFLWHWLLAVYATGNTDVTQAGAHEHDYLDPAAADTGNTTGIDTHDSFATAKGGNVDLTGPAVVDELTEIPTDPSAAVEPLLLKSGSNYFILSDFTAGQIEIVGTAPAGIDARLGLIRLE